MRVLADVRGRGELGVPPCHEGRGEGLRRLDGRYAPQSHLANQPILQGLVGALHPSLGLRVQRIDQFDAQALGDAAELGLAVAAGRLLGVDPEDAVPRPWDSRARERGSASGSRRASFRPARIGTPQTPRGVVDEDDQRAARTASLEPIVRTAVDLDQLAKARTPLAKLKHPLLASLVSTNYLIFLARPGGIEPPFSP